MTDNTAACGLSNRKRTIARHFAQARDYNQHADVQQQVCQLLLASIVCQRQDSVLEIGAGMGQMTRLLAQDIRSDHWLINELSATQAAILQSILPTANIAIGDAETMDLAGTLGAAMHSLIISANAVQWFDEPLGFIRQSGARLQTGGQLLFNTFTPNNFLQIKSLTGQGLVYPAVRDWQLELEKSGFTQIELSTHRFDLPFAQPYDVLKHMQLTGVSTNQAQIESPVKTQAHSQNKTSAHTEPFIWTKTRLQQFDRAYWQQFGTQDDNGQPCVNLTYEVLIVNAFKS